MGSEIISEIFNNYGLLGLGMFILAIVVLSVAIKKTSSHIANLSWPKFTFIRKIDPTLKDHLFFTNAHFKLRFDIPSLELLDDKPVLERMYIDLMYHTVEAFYYGCKGIIRIPEIGSMSGPEWDAEVKYALQCMIKSAEEKSDDFKVPKVVTRKYNKWISTYTNLLKDQITQLSNSAMYGDSTMRTNIFLLIMNLLIITMVGDLETVARDITDDMAGAVYRGRELEV